MDPEVRAGACRALEALDGVVRAVTGDERDPHHVFVISDRSDGPTEVEVRSVLAEHGYPVADADVRVAHLGAPEPRRRVRFVAAQVVPDGTGARARVTLEWAGETYRGEETGEAGAAMELRLCAQATIGALGRLLEDRVPLQLVGIKSFRAFDTDLVVVLLRHSAAGALVGSAVDPGDAIRSASLAVLNATNRVLGNYLMNPTDE
jgi:hypothetical protein